MKTKIKLYIIEKKFIGGALQGITIKEMTNVKFTVGQVVSNPVGGSPYKIVSIVRG